ncbi:MAG: hypothetical protein M3O62_04100 [Pseudomonadota bacterium]|nr:hypothetical protein [Pseudomonadota bacterium]
MKANQQLAANLERQSQVTTRRCLAQQMAPMLIKLVGIHPQGIDLVIWLAGPNCRNNLDATIHWIMTQLDDPIFGSADRPTSMLDLLVSRMTKQLSKVEGSYTCH